MKSLARGVFPRSSTNSNVDLPHARHVSRSRIIALQPYNRPVIVRDTSLCAIFKFASYLAPSPFNFSGRDPAKFFIGHRKTAGEPIQWRPSKPWKIEDPHVEGL